MHSGQYLEVLDNPVRPVARRVRWVQTNPPENHQPIKDKWKSV